MSRCQTIAAVIVGIGSFVMGAAAEAFPPMQIEHAYSDVVPALCAISFTSEITNPATGQTGTRQTQALGVIVSPDGLVLSHGHMQTENIEPSNIRISVGFGNDEREYEADFVGKPHDVNLSFLQIRGDISEPLPYVSFQRNSSLGIGEPILIFGLMGENLDFVRSVQVRRVGAILDNPRTTYCMDSPISFGFVTSPVVTATGELAGVIGYDMSPQEGGDLHIRSGHPLVYQAELFEQYIRDPETITAVKETVSDGWLGVFTQPLTDDLAQYWGLDQRGGVVISTIMQDSPAEAAGFQRGDIITAFNEIPVRARQDRDILTFTQLVRAAGVGESVMVEFLRDGAPMELEVTLAERPRAARDAGEYEDTVFGLTVREITTDLRLQLNMPDDVQGVIVRRVRSGSWADMAGMRPGVVIMNFGGHAIQTVDDFADAVEAVAAERPSEVAVFARLGPQTGFFRLTPRWTRQESE